MNRQESINAQALIIVESNGGKNMFNMKESAKILGCSTNSIRHVLNVKGALVTFLGRKKMVAAVELAKIMYAGQTSPLERYRISARGQAGARGQTSAQPKRAPGNPAASTEKQTARLYNKQAAIAAGRTVSQD